MKRGLLVLIAVVGLLGGAIALFVVTRTPAPQRDYIAEYDALVAQRFPDAQAGVREFEALLALDRYERVETIARDSVERAIERAAAEGLRVDLIEVDPLEAVVLLRIGEPRYWPDDPEQRATAERVLREARAEAIPLVLELLMDPAWRSAVAAFAAHDTVVMPTMPGPSLFDRLMPHFSPMRRSAMADAMTLRLSDDETARLEALRSILAMARSSATSPMLIGGLVQSAIEGLAYSITLDAAAGKAEPIVDPRAWLAEFERHEALRTDASWHFAGERLGMLDVIDAEYTKRPGAVRTHTPATLPVVGISHGQIYSILNDYHDALAEVVSRKPGEREEALPDPAEIVRRVDIRARVLLELVMPALDGAIANFDRDDAGLVGTITALALAAYRADHDAWPGSLDALVPRHLDAVPMDPFSPGAAEPLVYRVDGDGTVWLYSRGFDLTDNGGVRPSDPRDRGAGHDLVFLPRE